MTFLNITLGGMDGYLPVRSKLGLLEIVLGKFPYDISLSVQLMQ
jgi:hypothetical protein